MPVAAAAAVVCAHTFRAGSRGGSSKYSQPCGCEETDIWGSVSCDHVGKSSDSSCRVELEDYSKLLLRSTCSDLSQAVASLQQRNLTVGIADDLVGESTRSPLLACKDYTDLCRVGGV